MEKGNRGALNRLGSLFAFLVMVCENKVHPASHHSIFIYPRARLSRLS